MYVLTIMCDLLRLFVVHVAGLVIPKYFYVSREDVEAEKVNPGSQDRMASTEDAKQGNIFLWGQSVYIISQLLSVLSVIH